MQLAQPMQDSALSRARSGDRQAFNGLLDPLQPALRGMLRRMLGNLDDVDDLLQQTLLRAWESLGSFRGDAKFSTWVHSIAMRQALDHLRAQKRYRTGALIYAANDCVASGKIAQVAATAGAPDFHFDVYEHIRYCFACVGRSLEPEQQAALVLRDVYGLSNDEAAEMLGVTRSVLRHLLSQARKQMMDRYERLCSLVSKQGVCYQCEGLRSAAPEGQRGPAPREVFCEDTREVQLKRRLQIVRETHSDTSHKLHDLLAWQLHTLEQRRSDECDPEAIPEAQAPCQPS